MFLNCGRELSVASTKAFISQVTVLCLVTLWFAQRRRYKQTKKQRQALVSELRVLSGNMKKTLELSIEFSRLAVQKVLPTKHLFVAGTPGLGEVAAREGALKLKELTYIHCQAIKL